MWHKVLPIQASGHEREGLLLPLFGRCVLFSTLWLSLCKTLFRVCFFPDTLVVTLGDTLGDTLWDTFWGASVVTLDQTLWFTLLKQPHGSAPLLFTLFGSPHGGDDTLVHTFEAAPRERATPVHTPEAAPRERATPAQTPEEAPRKRATRSTPHTPPTPSADLLPRRGPANIRATITYVMPFEWQSFVCSGRVMCFDTINFFSADKPRALSLCKTTLPITLWYTF